MVDDSGQSCQGPTDLIEEPKLLGVGAEDMVAVNGLNRLVEGEVFLDEARSSCDGEEAPFDAVHMIAVAVELFLGEARGKSSEVIGIGRVHGAAEDVAKIGVGSPKGIVGLLPEPERDEGLLALVEDALDEGRSTPFDDYAAESPAEFFAVASECFFQDPHRLARYDSGLYDLLAEAYRQDPKRRVPLRTGRS
jgi:hypothetical protein